MKKKVRDKEKIILSIVVPVYNVEKYILECLKSLDVFKDKKEVEVLFIDDGSKDSSIEILEKYIENISNYKIYHKKNGGLSSARNYGLKFLNGKYVYFLDSDDIFYAKNYEIILEDLKNDYDIIRYNANVYYNNFFYYPLELIVKNIICTGAEGYLKYNKNNYVWLSIYKVDMLRSNNVKFYEGIIYEDMLFTPQVYLASKKIKIRNKIIVNYRQRQGSITKQLVTKNEIFSYLIINKELQLLNEKFTEEKINNILNKKSGQLISKAYFENKLQNIFDCSWFEKDKNLISNYENKMCSVIEKELKTDFYYTKGFIEIAINYNTYKGLFFIIKEMVIYYKIFNFFTILKFLIKGALKRKVWKK